MADLSQVLTALVGRVWSAIYPGGANTSPVNGYTTEVYAGWPVPQDLDADMAANPPVINVSVFPEGTERNTSRFERIPLPNVAGVPTITATVTNQTVTLTGTITAGQYVTIAALGQAVSYALLSNDTLTSAAAALTALLVTAGFSGATSSGGVITVPNMSTADMTATVGAPGTTLTEIGRQQKLFRITIWAPTQAARDATAAPIDNALRLIAPPMVAADFLAFADGSQGWLQYQSSIDLDQYEDKSISRRDLCYWVEYPTTVVGVGYPLTDFQFQITKVNTLSGDAEGSTTTVNAVVAEDEPVCIP